jgi:hypothetical protein
MTLINTKKHRDQIRIKRDMTVQEAILSVSEGIIGNVAWLTTLAHTRASCAFTGGTPIGHFYSIDDMGIYGESLWILFKHILDSDIDQFTSLCEALHSNRVNTGEIRDAVRHYGKVSLKEALLQKAGLKKDTTPDASAVSP